MGDQASLGLDVTYTKPEEEAKDVVQVVAVQPVAIVDHLLTFADEKSIRRLGVNDELGGSHRVDLEEVRRLLAESGEYYSRAGGSAANTTRGLAGFGVRVRLVGARGQDEWGVLFSSSMKRLGVDIGSLVTREGCPTARCCILTTPAGGQRTMRTAMAGAARLEAREVVPAAFAGASWAFVSAYALYVPSVLEATVDAARAAGCLVALDLASFEVVRAQRDAIVALLDSGRVALCFANEDEACALVDKDVSDEFAHLEGLAFAAARCSVGGVVTLGEKGCVVRAHGAEAVVAQPAVSGVKLTLGAEMTPATWAWLHARMHGELAGAVARDSAAAVQQELLACYALIERLGRGVVYYGSARLRRDSPHWADAADLGARVARLLGPVTTWSGGGPGMMQAVSEGAAAAGGAVGGIKIHREAGTTVLTAAGYLPPESTVYCRFLASRKVALVDCAVRARECDRTAYVFLPGGLGTMDELFELLTLAQLNKLGSRHPVPVILCNYRGFYSAFMDWLKACDDGGVLRGEELGTLLVADNNEGVLLALARHYGLEPPSGGAEPIVRPAAEWIGDAGGERS
ncbi:hypothetical protein QBZ16_001463 [Prototheca wickerhamii]|uniref:Carbohydrate kinase PfkB domain-containing protein n=1 Tax=Prototheca wickerhamii TaxID=3111 RepID=A0AAD9MGR5_PROWI|nr:hypothetical protein QBZ16_001463 [Prototheca wickerhamii]